MPIPLPVLRPPADLESRPPLRDIAAAHNVMFGAAVANIYLDHDPDFSYAFSRECGVLVPEWEAKWRTIQPSPGLFDFSATNRLLTFAQQHGMMFRGHNLVWHLFNPSWLPDVLKTDNPHTVLETHIRRVVEQYAGSVQAWDVVNEAVEPKDGRIDGLRKSIWLDAIGPGYIDLAFHTARAADPQAKLVYNDHGLDHADFETTRKRQAVLELLHGMRERNVPIDALGLQGHLWADRAFDAVGLRRFIRDVARLGLDVYVTELDVTDVRLPDDRYRDEAVARLTGDYLTAALAEPAVKGITTWGLSDKYSWLNTASAPWAHRSDGELERGLPLDAACRRKPMWTAIADVLSARAAIG